MATRLVVGDTSLDIGRIVERTIGDLREMIGAETMYFVIAPAQGGMEIAQSCPSSPEASPVAVDTILRLARVHRARSRPRALHQERPVGMRPRGLRAPACGSF